MHTSPATIKHPTIIVMTVETQLYFKNSSCVTVRSFCPRIVRHSRPAREAEKLELGVLHCHARARNRTKSRPEPAPKPEPEPSRLTRKSTRQSLTRRRGCIQRRIAFVGRRDRMSVPSTARRLSSVWKRAMTIWTYGKEGWSLRYWYRIPGCQRRRPDPLPPGHARCSGRER